MNGRFGLGWLAPSIGSLRAFFISFAIGFAAFVAAGHVISNTNYLVNFSKFHLYLNPQTLYYPTASQVVTLAKEAGDRGKIVVIVGGSSVMWGAGQSESELWTHALQRNLGDQYETINLALPSGSPQEHGSVATQHLLKNGYKPIYLADMGATFSTPDGIFYPHVYWDAYYRGYLFPNPEALPVIERKSVIRRTISPPLEEIRARSALDAALRFTDFWNFVGYKVMFTTWNYLVQPPAGQFYTPRQHFTDPQAPFPPSQRYVNPPFDIGMDIVRGFVTRACPTRDDGPGSTANATSYWSGWDEDANVAFPTVVRPNIVIVRVMHATPYRDALTDDERQCYAKSFAEVSTRLRAFGYGSAEIGADWTEEDYVDVVHPSAVGGLKMADALASRVRALAHELGYEK